LSYQITLNIPKVIILSANHDNTSRGGKPALPLLNISILIRFFLLLLWQRINIRVCYWTLQELQEIRVIQDIGVSSAVNWHENLFKQWK